MTEAAFYQALKWREAIASSLLNPVAYPFHSEHLFWVFRIDPSPPVIDLEVNLAEPQILVRLNSVLERDPMLVLTEHDHSAFYLRTGLGCSRPPGTHLTQSAERRNRYRATAEPNFSRSRSRLSRSQRVPSAPR
jgi:hypothetical protein